MKFFTAVALLVVLPRFANAIQVYDNAPGTEEIAQVNTKGLIFKDKIKILAFNDPNIAGVTCYTTFYDRMFSLDNATESSLSCRQTGPITGDLGAQENVFSQSKSLFFKSTQIDRLYDRRRNVLIYLSYTKNSLDLKGRNASHSISVIPIADWK